MSADQKEAPPRVATGTGRKETNCGFSSTSPKPSQGPFPLPPIDGIHTWTIEAAWYCRKAGMSAGEAVSAIQAYDGTLRRRLQPREAIQAVERAYSVTLTNAGRFERVPELPAWNSKETARLHSTIAATPESLTSESPEEDPADMHPRAILSRLFPDPDGLLCIGRSMSSFTTATLTQHSGIRDSQFIVPAFMLAKYGTTLDGRKSEHTKENTGPRRFIVFDFDSPPPDQHASIIRHLAKFRPLVMVLKSGGRSLHAWFSSTTSIEDDRLFWRLGIALGADPVLFRNPSQFVRLPNGTRNTGAKQEVVYLNPAAAP